MGTRLQKKLAKAIVEDAKNDHPSTGQQLLEKVGYSKTVARSKPGEILERKGVKEELNILGFNESDADNVVSTIMLDDEEKAQQRLNAADLVYKRLGSYAPEKSQSINMNINTKPEDIDKFQKLREEYEQKLLNEIGA